MFLEKMDCQPVLVGWHLKMPMYNFETNKRYIIMASLIYMTLNFHMHMKEEKDQEATVLAPLPSKSPSLTDT